MQRMILLLGLIAAIAAVAVGLAGYAKLAGALAAGLLIMLLILPWVSESPVLQQTGDLKPSRHQEEL